jgi:hypothetical protein
MVIVVLQQVVDAGVLMASHHEADIARASQSVAADSWCNEFAPYENT